MIRTAKIKAVATFEFLTTVKRPGYLITTFGMPVFMGLYAMIIGLPAYYATSKQREATVIGVVDHAGIARLAGDAAPSEERLPPELRKALEAAGQRGAIARSLAEENFVFRPFPDEETARRAVASNTIKSYFVLPPDYVESGRVDVYQADAAIFSGSDARRAFEGLLRERLVAGRVQGAAAARILDPIQTTRAFAVTRTGAVRQGGRGLSVVRLVFPLAFMVLFLMSVLMTSGYLIQGTATEKENKVVEVLLASANPDEVLAGKLFGLGGAGLLQVIVWLAMLTAGGVGVVPLVMSSGLDFPWHTLALAVPLFALGFLFYGSVMMGTGSLGSNMREAQQLVMIWSLTAALPLIMMAVLMRDPHGVFARVMTWLPITAAPLVILRSSLDPAALAWWEIAGAFVVLAISAWLGIRVGARLFRIGLLSSGSRPSLREIIRQARLAA